MNDYGECLAGMIIVIAIPFAFGIGVGGFMDANTKADDLAKVLYKDTDKYLQHRHNNFYDLLELVEIKEQGCIKKK